MQEALTEKQESVLNFIEQYQLENGSSPTLREMREHFGVSSDNSILKHVKALEEKGYIVKDDTPRGIKLLTSVKNRLSAPEFRLPLLGTVPAGVPVDAIEHVEQWLDVGRDVVYKNSESFLLRVKGDSMIDVGIYEGDIVIVSSGMAPKVADIVVALVDGQSTVKRYMMEGKKVYLKPENSNYSNIYPEGELCIQGVVTGLLRYYKR